MCLKNIKDYQPQKFINLNNIFPYLRQTDLRLTETSLFNTRLCTPHLDLLVLAFSQYLIIIILLSILFF